MVITNKDYSGTGSEKIMLNPQKPSLSNGSILIRGNSLIHSTKSVARESRNTMATTPDYIYDGFFLPKDPLTASYSDEFLSAFSKSAEGSEASNQALAALKRCAPQELARLPLFDTASNAYKDIVAPACKKFLLAKDDHSEMLETKRMIMLCASQYSYASKLKKVLGVSKNDVICLSHVNLSYQDLNRINLENALLAHTNLIGTNLEWATLDGINFTETDLSQTNLHGASLKKTFLENADLSRQDLRDVDFSYANIINVNFSGANLLDAEFYSARMYSNNLSAAKLSSDCFRYAINL